MARLLEARGVRNHVLDPASPQVNRRARRAKTDRIDAANLLRALMAHRRGEPKVVSVVRVPSVAEEDARRLHRERHRLVGERTQQVNRIKGLCATQGIYDFHPLRRDRWQRLAGLRTGDGRAMPPRLAAELARELKRLELAALEAERDAVVEAPASAHPHAPKIQALAKLKGDRRRVRDRAGRRGVPPRLRQPSPAAKRARRQADIARHLGNPKARTTMVELAWMWLRHQLRVRSAAGSSSGSAPSGGGWPDRRRRAGAQAASRPVALPRDRPRAGRRRAQRLRTRRRAEADA